jgi:hypothetical protein
MPGQHSLNDFSKESGIEVNAFRMAFMIVLIVSAVGNLSAPLLLGHRFNTQGTNWSYHTMVIGILNGLLLGQFMAISVWMLSDPMAFARKWLIGTSAGFLLGLTLVIGAQAWPGMPMGVAIFFVVVGTVLPTVLCGLLSIVSMLPVHGLQLYQPDHQTVPASKQFGVGYLLVVMLCLSVAFVIVQKLVPANKDTWLSAWDFVVLGVWMVWLSFATSVFVWYPMTAVLQPRFSRIVICMLLVLFGPTLFQWVVWCTIRMERFRFSSPSVFPPLAQCISFGLLLASLLLGLLLRLRNVSRAKEAHEESACLERASLSSE